MVPAINTPVPMSSKLENRGRCAWQSLFVERASTHEGAEQRTSRSLQSICKDINFVIRFGRIGCGGGNHGCEGHFGKEVCCAAERATRSADTQRQERSAAAAEGADIVEGGCVGSR